MSKHLWYTNAVNHKKTMTMKDKSRQSRQGKHKEMKTLFGAYVDPEVKALAVLTSDRLGISFTDIILNGLRSEAIRAGIMLNDQIRPEYLAAFNAVLEIVKARICKNRKGVSNAENQ